MKRALQERELSPGGEVLDEFLDSSVACYPRLGAWGVGGGGRKRMLRFHCRIEETKPAYPWN